MPVRPIPEGFHTVTPALRVADAAAAIAHYVEALGAVELYRLTDPSGKVAHAEIKVGDSIVMVSDEYPEWGVVGPKALGGTPVGMHVFVEDADAAFDRAVAAGSSVVMPVSDQFYGVRSGKVRDPFGHEWTLSRQVEVVSPEEIARRFEDWLAANATSTA